MKKNMTHYAAGAALVAAVLLASCSGPYDEPAPQDSSVPQVLSGAGTAVIRISGGDGPALTIMPTSTPDMFSRYELTLTKGETTLTPDASGIAGEGVAVELEAGEWLATVKSYRRWKASDGADREYLAATGSATLTVTVGGTNAATVNTAPVAIEDAAGARGIFSWKLVLPEGLSSAELRLEAAETGIVTTTAVNLLTTAEGSVEVAAGTYHLFITLEKGGLRAGLYEWAYVYPGLESPAVFDFAGGEGALVFTDSVLLAGTATATNETSAVVGALTVNAYSDGTHQNAIGSAEPTGGAWLLSIPASSIGQHVYLSLSAAASAAYAPPEDACEVAALPASGQAGIALELKFLTGAPITGLGGVLQLGATTTATAATAEAGEKRWSSSNASVASVDAASGVVTALVAGDTTISYTVTAGDAVRSNSKAITVYAATQTLAPTYAPFTGMAGAKALPTNAAEIAAAVSASGGTASFVVEDGMPSDERVATIDASTGELTLVQSGSITVHLKIVRLVNGEWMLTHQGTSASITVTKADPVASRNNGAAVYATLAAAITAATGTSDTPDVITIVDNITLDSAAASAITTAFTSGKHVKLTVPSNETHTIKRGSGGIASLFTVSSGRSLTLEGNGTGNIVIDGGAVWSSGNPATRTDFSGITAGGPLITVSGGALKMNDGAKLANNNRSGTAVGGAVLVSSGNFTMTGGLIADNRGGNGGGVAANGTGAFTMTGGVISGNYTPYNGGGAKADSASAVVTLSGTAEVSGNYAGIFGGGGVSATNGTIIISENATVKNNVSAAAGGGVYLETGNETLTMTGGTISGNSAATNGGGVYVDGGSTLTMTDGTISDNTATGNGKGVYSGGTFNMEGYAVVANNNDVYLPYSSNRITITGDVLTGPIDAATITVPSASYAATTQVLDGYTTDNFTKFAVTPSGFSTWDVINTGRLRRLGEF